MKWMQVLAFSVAAAVSVAATDGNAWDRVDFDGNYSVIVQTGDCAGFSVPWQIRLTGFTEDTQYVFEGSPDTMPLDMFLVDIVAYASSADYNAAATGTRPSMGFGTLIMALPREREGVAYPDDYYNKTYGGNITSAYDRNGFYAKLSREQREAIVVPGATNPTLVFALRVRDYTTSGTKLLGQMKLPGMCKPISTFSDALVASGAAGDLKVRVAIGPPRASGLTGTMVTGVPDWPNRKQYKGLTVSARVNGEATARAVPDLVVFDQYQAEATSRKAERTDLLLTFAVDPSVRTLDDISISYEGGFTNKYGSITPPGVWPVMGKYPL